MGGSLGNHSGSFEGEQPTWDWVGSLGDHPGNFEGGHVHLGRGGGSLGDHAGSLEVGQPTWDRGGSLGDHSESLVTLRAGSPPGTGGDHRGITLVKNTSVAIVCIHLNIFLTPFGRFRRQQKA